MTHNRECVFWPCDLPVCVCPQAILQVILQRLLHTHLTSTRRAPRDTLQVKPCISCLHEPAVFLVCHVTFLSLFFFVMKDTQRELPTRCPRHRRTEPLRRTRRPRVPTPQPCTPSEVPTRNKTFTLRCAGGGIHHSSKECLWALIFMHD